MILRMVQKRDLRKIKTNKQGKWIDMQENI